MEWSRFNRLFKSSKRGYLLYNTLTQALIQVPDDEIEKLTSIRDNPDSIEDKGTRDCLLAGRFIVESNLDELAFHVNRVLKNRYNPTTMSLTIAVTRACNFNCVYCYEDDRAAIHMDESVENDVVSFVKRNTNLKSLFVVWYGGEPLLNFDAIKRLSAAFMALGIEYNAFIVTNGYLLSDEIASQLDKLRVKGLQITLDGLEECHNSRRMLKGGGGTFEVITRNIERLLEINPNIRLDIRSNIDKRNAEEYGSFYRQIRAKFPQPNVRIYTGFSHDLLGSGCVPSDIEMTTPNDRASFYLENYDKRQLPIVDFSFHTQLSTCLANNLTGFVVGPQGEVYKCWTVIGNPKEIVGFVSEPDKFNQSLLSRYMAGADYLFDPECRECYCLPICTGGCPLARICSKYEGRKIDFCSVAKQNLEAYVERFIEQKTRREAAG